MADGQRAADQTKSAFTQIGDMSESIRKNINSYADNILGGNKTHSSTGVHPDAKKTGAELEKGAGEAEKKIEDFVHKHQKR